MAVSVKRMPATKGCMTVATDDEAIDEEEADRRIAAKDPILGPAIGLWSGIASQADEGNDA